jgi:signal transduction histidine kinase
MKIFKSMKWRLQLWYGLILVLVLAGFGFTAYQLERGRQFGRIDDELHRRVGALAAALHRPPRHHGGPEFDGPPPGPGMSPDGEPPDRDFQSLPESHLPPEVIGLFETNDPNHFYFVIDSRDGTELAQCGNPPVVDMKWENPPPPGADAVPAPHADFFHATSFQTFGKYREVMQTLPSGEMIRVGCDIGPELRANWLIGLKLAGFGGIILFFGLAGGRWFVGRALQPIAEISSAATRISGGNLSQRINVADAESELGQLANVLNSTFARLETAFDQQKQFAADAAHELRTPVTVILTQTQTTLSRERDAAGYKQTLEACQRAAQRMRKLIESLLALARLDAGQEVMAQQRFDLAKTVEDSVAALKPLAHERGVTVVTELEPTEIKGDSGRLEQVATNLVANAIQYNKPKGEVRVSLKTGNGLAVLTVTDSGHGISAGDLPHVFERFYRADKSRTGSSNTGLGLAISQAIVSAHAGTIEVSSEKNVRTTFTVRLPKA